MEQSEDDLYWAVGDGGPPFDLLSRASDLDTLLGKIIRITVPRSGTGYTLPDGNVRGTNMSRGKGGREMTRPHTPDLNVNMIKSGHPG